MSPNSINLSLLKDIHITGFALAWGWWLVISLSLCSAVCLSVYLTNRWYKNKYRRFAIQSLLHCHPQNLALTTYLTKINEILKFVALRTFPDQKIAALTGTNWLNFLDQHWPKKNYNKFAKTTGSALTVGAYVPNYKFPSDDLLYIRGLAIEWVKKHKGRVK